MSSLGFQTIYRGLHALDGVSAERAFLPDDARAARQNGEGLATYESGRPVGDFPVVAFSLAYELELAGLVDCLDLAGIPALASERAARGGRWPLIVIGGPLTFSNPLPAGPVRRRDRHGRGRRADRHARRRDPRPARSRLAARAPGQAARLLRPIAARRAAAEDRRAAQRQAAGVLADPHRRDRAVRTCS